MRATARQRGFSLIEAIVALAMIGSVGVAMMAWLNTSLTSLSRVQASAERMKAMRAGAEFIGSVNPMRDGTGEASLGGYSVSWQSAAREGPVVTLVNPDGTAGVFAAALYDVQVEVSRESRQVAGFAVLQLGFRRLTADELTGWGGG